MIYTYAHPGMSASVREWANRRPVGQIAEDLVKMGFDVAYSGTSFSAQMGDVEVECWVIAEFNAPQEIEFALLVSYQGKRCGSEMLKRVSP